MAKLKASTIIETIVALIIITVAFLLFSVFTLNIWNRPSEYEKLQAQDISQQIYERTTELGKLTKEYKLLKVKSETKNYKGNKQILLIQTKVSNSKGHELLNQKRIKHLP